MYYHPVVAKMDWVCCSPKMLYSKKKFEDKILEDTDEVKCVVTNEKDLDFYLDYFKDFKGEKVFQPVDSDKKKISRMIAGRKLNDWKVQIQQHVIMELR